MEHVKSITVLATAVVVVACASLTFPRSCTDIAVAGISLAVVDSITGAQRLSGATVRARDGSFVDSMVFRDDTTLFQSGDAGAALALERAGTYAVSVSHAGYRDWTASNVRVRDDGCHVRTAHLVARLIRAE